MSFSSITIQGNILSSDILQKIRQEDLRFQQPADFGLARNLALRDEIGMAWASLQAHWKAFSMRRERLKESDSGTTETRNAWMLPFFRELGYELEAAKAELINEKSYAISHRDTRREGFPVHLVGINQSLDKRADGGARLSPHALAQEYLNNSEHLYALTSNGQFLRLLRDATRLSRLSYIEFDLQRMMEEELYAEFALLYRVLHASRMPAKLDAGAESIIEFYHQEALASGSRIRGELSRAVEKSIRTLANGILQHPANTELRSTVQEGRMSPNAYYLYTLRLVYRMLFLMVIEERKLIYPEQLSEEQQKQRSIYLRFYSLQRLCKLAEQHIYVDGRKTDLWQSLISTFNLFETAKYGQKLGISPLGAGIFAPDALGLLSQQMLDNETLLKVLRFLVTFENEQGQRVRVNYADLDVEEFGSVYEGLLEYAPEITEQAGEMLFGFVKGSERSSSGSHYTPEELVRPLIKHSLDYLIEDKLKEADPEKGLLSLSICDVACGSGHILLSAARRVGFELAKLRSKEDQPSPPVLRTAVRDVIRHCIYGVDLNPLAVELCKVALWLEAHAPGEPLNFLDHHIKCGNAIVGLAHAEELEKGIASEAFKTLPGDDKEIASAFKKRNDQEIKTSAQLSTFDVEQVDLELKDVQRDFLKFSQLPENTPEQIVNKEKAYQELTNGKKWWRLKNLADLQVAQFFIPKTTANKEKLTTHAQYMTYLKQGTQILDRGASMALGQEKRFFHWFLEFPEVFQKAGTEPGRSGGFDCILGNPPFLGGLRISSNFGDSYLSYLKFNFAPAGGTCDFVAYFFRRDFDIIKIGGFQSLISTNTISQGDTREGALDVILNDQGNINFAVKSMKWPGQANLEITLVTINKQYLKVEKYIKDEKVDFINALLETGNNIGNPKNLIKNELKCFTGSTVLGKGFVLEPDEAMNIISTYPKHKEVIVPYLIGDDINSSYIQTPSRFVINFFDWSEEKAKEYIWAYNHLKEFVYPSRMEDKRKAYRDRWWLFAERRVELYKRLPAFKMALVVCRVTKFLSFSFVTKGYVYDVGANVILFDNYSDFSVLHSTIHECWARKYGSSLETRLRYTNEDCFENFPFPENLSEVIKQELELDGYAYHEHRRQLMLGMQLGLTKTYNLFHSKGITQQGVDEKDKQVQALRKHLEKTPETISFEAAVEGILKLRALHIEMDEAVLEAYGWAHDDAKWGMAIALRHDFYEVDYLPENDRIRYTIHPDARKEVLKRLLQLNHERYAEEVAAGLHDKKGAKKEKKAVKGKAGNNTGELFGEGEV